MFKTISKFIMSHGLGQLFKLEDKQVAWKKAAELKAGQKIAIVGPCHSRPASQRGEPDRESMQIDWDEIVSIKKVGQEQVYDIEVAGTHNFVAGHYVNQKTGQALTEEQEKAYLEYEKAASNEAAGKGMLNPPSLRTNYYPTTTDQDLSSPNSLVRRAGDLHSVPASAGTQGFLSSAPSLRVYSPLENILTRLEATGVDPDDVEYGGIVAHNTSGILMRAGASSLQLSSSATSTTADIELAAADQMDLFAGRFSLTTSSLTNGVMNLSSTGTLTLDTSRTNAPILMLGGKVGIGTTSPVGKLQVIENTSGATKAFLSSMSSNYTGSSTDTLGVGIANNTAGTGTWEPFAQNTALFANMSADSFTFGTTAGTNIGFRGFARNSSTINIGVHGLTDTSGVNAKNYGVFGGTTASKNGGSTTELHVGVAGAALNGDTNVGGFFGLMSSPPTFTSAALIADNGATTSPTFLARDNGTSVFVINDGGNVGIGTTGPLYTLDVSGGTRVIGDYGVILRAGTSSINLSSGTTSTTADLQLAAADQMDLFASKFSLTTSSASNGQIVLSSAGGITLDTSRGSGILTITGSMKAASLGEGSGTALVADSNGNIIRNTSSLRYKRDVTDLDFDSSAIFDLNPQSFTWNSQGTRDFGLIAEEVAATLPQLTLYDKEGRPEAVKYSQLSVLLLEETKKLKEELTALQAADLKRSLLARQGDSSSGDWQEQIAAIDAKIFGAQAAFDTQQTMIEGLQKQIDDLLRTVLARQGDSSSGDPTATESAALSATPQDVESLKNRVSLLEDLIAMLTANLDPAAGSQRTVLARQGQSSPNASGSAAPEGTVPLKGTVPFRDFALETSAGSNVELANDLTLDSSASYNGYNDYKIYNIYGGVAQIMGDATIGGSLTVGSLYFDDIDSSISSISDTLKIQSSGLADIEFLGGKVILNKNGNLTVFGEVAAEKVTAGEYAVLGAGKTIGSAVIPTGENIAFVENSAVKENSKIFTQLTAAEGTVPLKGTVPFSLMVTKLPSQGFEVQIAAPAENDINFDYWIVQEE